MDENILTNESREEEDSQNIRTPGAIKNLNVNSINAINSAGFSNHQAMKKMKASNKMINQSKTNGSSSLANKAGAANQAQTSHNLHVRPKTQINGQRTSGNRGIDNRINNSMAVQNSV